MSNELTPEQQARIPEIREQWFQYGMATGPCDRQRIEEAVKVSYEKAGLTPVPVVWVLSPMAGATLAAQFARPECTGPDFRCEVTKREIADNAWTACYGQHDASWLGYYAATREFGKVEETEPFVGGLFEMVHAGWWWPFDGACIVSERPNEVHVDPDESAGFRLHREDGPVMSWPDGYAIYCWHGVAVPKLVIENPELITVQMIDDETNAEVRRVMLERYGFDRYMVDAGAEIVDESLDMHGRVRRLLRLPPRPNSEEPVMAVQLTNSSPEPDGTFKLYVLRVDPQLRPLIDDGLPTGDPQKLTALNAVASTFGMTGEQYQLTMET